MSDRLRTNLKRGAAVSNVVVRRGMGPLGVLGIIFVLCKIFQIGVVATWSWWLVLLPFYVGFLISFGLLALILAVGVAVFIIGIGCIGISHLWKSWKYRYRVQPPSRKFR